MTTQTTTRLDHSGGQETAAKNNDSVSVIDRHSHFDGLYRTAYDLRIEGSVEGEIECEGTITVAEDARLAAKVQARNVIVAGTAEGEINCSERFTILPTGDMRGQVVAQSLVVEEGAFFEGTFEMTNKSSGSIDSTTKEWSSNSYANNNSSNGKKEDDWFSFDHSEEKEEKTEDNDEGEEASS